MVLQGGIGLWGGKCILQDPAMQRSERECGLFMEGGASKCRFKGVVGGFSWLADSEFGPGSQIFEPGSKVNIKSGWTEKMEKFMKEFWFVIDASILWQSFAESLYSVMYQTNVMHWVRIPHWGRCLAEPSDHELWISPLIIARGSITNSSSALVHILAHTDTNTGTQTHTQTQRRFHKQIQTYLDTETHT